ncbi:GAP family protein [Microbacterium sp.]|uniref:GAP family protein n=1 Tax=Microbacterium sp. TaxID=51671 RepID=UPI002811B192|nr:GAP family protein [Microbacterium sp.]
MGTVIGSILPFAVGIAISPVPIIVVILTLLSPRARSSSLGFLVGFLVGILGGFVALTLVSSLLPSHHQHGANPWEGVIKLALGALLVLLAVRQWRKRPQGDEKPEMPSWMQKIDSFGFMNALGLGLVLSIANPKNLILTAGASVDVGASDLSIEAVVVAVAVFTLVAASAVIVPVVAFLVAADRLRPGLNALHTWLTRENHVIMAVMFIVLGANSIGKGLGAIWP